MKIIMDVMTSKIEFEDNEQALIPVVHDEMHRKLGVRQEGYFYSPAYKAGYWDGLVDFYNKEDNSFHTGLVNQVDTILGGLQSQHAFVYSIEDIRPAPFMAVEDLPNDITLVGDGEEPITLRDYQYDAVAQVVDKQVGIVEVATNGGKCLPIDSRILTTQGYLSLRDIFDKHNLPHEEGLIENTIGLNIINRYGESEKPSHITVNGERETKRITTDLGLELVGTLNHPVLSVDYDGSFIWKPIGELVEGDWVVSTKNHVYPESSGVNGFALGALTADGYYGSDTQVTFTNNRQPLLDMVEQFMIGEGLVTKLDLNGNSKDSYILRGTNAKGFYTHYGISLGVAKNKRVPEAIMSGSKQEQLDFLSSYIECEGYIDVNRLHLEVSSASKELLKELQLMLISLGYSAKVSTKKVKEYTSNYYGVLTLGASDTYDLLHRLSFYTEEANNSKVSFYENYVSRGRNDKSHTVPYGKEVAKAYARSYTEHVSGLGKKFYTPKTISRTKLRSLVQLYPNGSKNMVDIVNNLISGQNIFSQVISTEDVGVQPTYDLHVPETHSFIAEGIVNHNTEIAGAVIQQLLPRLERGERIAFFTNNSSIFTQSIERIEKRLGIKVGRYGAGQKDFQQVTFVMIPTLNASLTADPEKGLKLTGKNAVIKKIAKDIAPRLAKGVNQRMALRNLIKNYPQKSSIDKKVAMELEDVLYSCGTDNEIKFKIQGYEAEYQRIVATKNKKVYDKHNEALDFLESVAVMIVDEAHHTSADTWFQSLSKCVNAYYRVALTGSVDRKDAMLWQRLQAIFNKTIIKISNETLINLGHSAKPKITMFPIVSPQGYEEADYMPAREVCIVKNKYRNTLIAQLTKKCYDEGKGILILVNIVEHGEIISKLLNDFGVENSFIHGELDLDYREEQLNEMRSGRLKVLIATTIADEGLDISNIDMLILGAGGKSLRQTLQRVGRALRKKKTGENEATIIDFIDYTNKHLLKHSKERRKTYVQEKFDIEDITIN